jgi:large subunit ribosomal protein L16
MLLPKKVLHRKWQRGRGRSKATPASRSLYVEFGVAGLKSTQKGWLSSREIEAARRVMVRYIRKGGRVWTRIFPDRPVTSKGTHFTMGSGKGAPEYFVATVRPGTVMFEMGGMPVDQAVKALLECSYKLSLKSKVITKER